MPVCEKKCLVQKSAHLHIWSPKQWLNADKQRPFTLLTTLNTKSVPTGIKTQIYWLTKQHLPTSQSLNFTPKFSCFPVALPGSAALCPQMTSGALVPHRIGQRPGSPQQHACEPRASSRTVTLSLTEVTYECSFSRDNLLYTNRSCVSCCSFYWQT